MLATIALAVPAGWAVGQQLDELSGATQVSAEDCGSATKIFKDAGLIAPAYYADGCPSRERALEVATELLAAGRALANDQPDPGTDPGGEPDPGTDPGGEPDPGTDPGGEPDPGTDPGGEPSPSDGGQS